jgi:hypothetical protein
MAEVDLGLVADARGRIPALKHARPFTVEVAAAPRHLAAAE